MPNYNRPGGKDRNDAKMTNAPSCHVASFLLECEIDAVVVYYENQRPECIELQ